MSKQLLQKLMVIAKLDLPESEQVSMINHLEKLCDWIEELQEVDTTNVVPLTTHVTEPPILREDSPAMSLPHDKAVGASPYSDSNYFRVPKVKA
jgi:aspartyl-tRNA(Asn)/glutamyl-tRNA(Gln) amidotransferase subunit C